MNKILLITSIMLTINFSQDSYAQNSPTYRDTTGFSDTCYAQNIFTGRRMAVRSFTGFANGYMAFATSDVYGNPTITFNWQKINNAGIVNTIVARFLYFHECGHFQAGGQDEIQASCNALREMRHRRLITPNQEQIVERYHDSIGFMGYNYGGTGRNHWQRTLQCANNSPSNNYRRY